MTSAKNAFDVYTHSRDKEESDYGQGLQSFLDFILFWKDKYFVIVNTQEVTPESESAIQYPARLIDRSIPETGEIPVIVNTLPKEELVSAGFLYFHHYIWLNAYYSAKHIELADTRYHLGTADPAKIELIKLGWDEESFV